jgi:hypothetical protein
MKPKLIYDVLRQTSPRKLYGKSIIPPNRFNVLSRDASPADSLRSSFSSVSVPVKRKNNSDEHSGNAISYADVTLGNSHQVSMAPSIDKEALTTEIVKVKSLCEKFSDEVGKSNVDPALIPILSILNEAMTGICNVQMKIVEAEQVPVTISHSSQPAAPAKKPRSDPDPPVMVDLGSLSQQSRFPRNAATAVDPKVKKFKEAVKDAEKSTLIFNLDLGKVPIINQDTMSTRVTGALMEMAAKVEKKQGNIPSEETVAAIDDVLSTATGMHFFGKATKSYSRTNDPRSGSFCTIPVKYDFSDKDTRQYAETVLKDCCKLQCATPYPTILREMIRQVLNKTKESFPNNYVKVSVDIGSLALKVVRRPLLVGKNGEKKTWFNVGEPIPIPTSVYDLSARKVPEDFVVDWDPAPAPEPDLNDTELMATDAEPSDSMPPPSQSAPPPAKQPPATPRPSRSSKK